MKSATLPAFWEAYEKLDEATKERARKAFSLWEENPFHPSLRFKNVNPQEGTWSVRITRGIRALGIMKDDTVTRFWIGSHDVYERHI
jgi:Txe/YoeB family toxin of Txe-Axe toxin-antitoxin module